MLIENHFQNKYSTYKKYIMLYKKESGDICVEGTLEI